MVFEKVAADAIKLGLCLTISYGRYTRLVEVHAVGVNDLGHHIMSVWQVSGGSESNEPVGWKLLRLDEMTGCTLTNIQSGAPRQGYRPNAKQFTRILAQI